MKQLFALMLAPVLVLILLACTSQPVSPPTEKKNIQEAVALAEQETAEEFDLIVRARHANDPAPLREYLQDHDPNGELKTLMKQHNIETDLQQLAKPGEFLFPVEDLELFDGDILIIKTIGSIMELLIPGEYTHCGVFDAELFQGNLSDKCLLSATLGFNAEGNFVNGVTYESFADWSGAGKLAVMRKASISESGGLDDAQWAIASRINRSAYAFLYLNLEPVYRFDPFLWYCSKTSWRVYDLLNIDIEYAEYYGSYSTDGFEPSDEFIELTDRDGERDSFLFILYYRNVKRHLWWHPRKEQKAQEIAEAWAARVLTELISPDEIRYATGDNGPLTLHASLP